MPTACTRSKALNMFRSAIIPRSEILGGRAEELDRRRHIDSNTEINTGEEFNVRWRMVDMAAIDSGIGSTRT
jgi:hypothetical protein